MRCEIQRRTRTHTQTRTRTSISTRMHTRTRTRRHTMLLTSFANVARQQVSEHNVGRCSGASGESLVLSTSRPHSNPTPSVAAGDDVGDRDSLARCHRKAKPAGGIDRLNVGERDILGTVEIDASLGRAGHFDVADDNAAATWSRVDPVVLVWCWPLQREPFQVRARLRWSKSNKCWSLHLKELLQ